MLSLCREGQSRLWNQLFLRTGTFPAQINHSTTAILEILQHKAVRLPGDKVDSPAVLGGCVGGPVIDKLPAVHPQTYSIVAVGIESISLGTRRFRYLPS